MTSGVGQQSRQLITRTRPLWKAVNACAACRVIAVDTESNSFWAYQERVCVIQLMAGESVFLIDPLALEDLSPLGVVFQDPGIIKIFHGADYDLRCLWRDFHLRPAPIFDTMVAASLLAYPALGLGALVERHFGVRLPKSNALTRYDWAKRPLPEAHLDYLINDVLYLAPLREILTRELQAKDLIEEAEYEFRQLEQMGMRQPKTDVEDFLSIKGARQLEPVALAVLKRLFEYREHVARRRNVPRFKVLSNAVLLSLAQARPHHLKALREVEGVSEGLLRIHGQRILQAIRAGQGDFEQGLVPVLPERKLVRGPEVDNDLLASLKAWRSQEAARRGVSPHAVLPTSCLKDIAQASHLDLLALSQLPGMTPRRLQRYAKEILSRYHRKPHAAPAPQE